MIKRKPEKNHQQSKKNKEIHRIGWNETNNVRGWAKDSKVNSQK
jgi:hypothetical protein